MGRMNESANDDSINQVYDEEYEGYRSVNKENVRDEIETGTEIQNENDDSIYEEYDGAYEEYQSVNEKKKPRVVEKGPETHNENENEVYEEYNHEKYATYS